MHQDRAASAAAIDALRLALGSGTDEQVSAAASRVRELGTSGADLPWHAIYHIEARAAARQALCEQLRAGDTAGIARAWSRCVALPGMRLDDDENAAGRDAFRRWGHALRLARMGDSRGGQQPAG